MFSKKEIARSNSSTPSCEHCIIPNDTYIRVNVQCGYFIAFRMYINEVGLVVVA